jgi:hypothetical protein
MVWKALKFFISSVISMARTLFTEKKVNNVKETPEASVEILVVSK